MAFFDKLGEMTKIVSEKASDKGKYSGVPERTGRILLGKICRRGKTGG